MKITVFGSTGPLGVELIKQALERGYEVVAYARSTEKLQHLANERLNIIKGDLANRKQIERAVSGVDAVISVLGPKGKVNNTELSDGINTIIKSMNKVGLKRIVALSTGSVKDALDRFDLTYRFLVSIVKLTVKGAYNEIIRIGELIHSSNLDWTLVRVGLLNNGEAQPVKVGYYGHGVVGVKISRASIAKFMLDQAAYNEHMKKSPAISD